MGVISLQGYRGKLVAGDVVLDLFKDEEILISNNSTELFDIGAVPATYSKSILLPGTKLNNDFFQDALEFDLEDPNKWRSDLKIRAYFDFDGIYLVDGYIQLNKVNLYQNKFVDSYEITLFGIISNIGVDLKRLFLTDLSPLSKYNHTASWDAVSQSWAGNLFNGDVVYHLADAGQKYFYAPGEFSGIDEYVAAVNVQDLKPAIRLKAVWDAIFEKSGYTYTGSFWNQSFLEDVYVIANNDKKSIIVNNNSIEDFGRIKLIAQNSSSIFTTNTDYPLPDLQFTGKELDNSFKYDSNTGVYNLDTRSPLRGNIRLNFQLSGSITKANQRSAPGGFAIWVRDAATNTLIDQSVLVKINNIYGDQVKTSFRTSQISADQGNSLVNYLQDFDLEEAFSTSTLPSGSYKFSLYVYPGGGDDLDIRIDRASNPKSYFEITKVDWAADYKLIDIPSNMPFGESGVKLLDFVTSLQKKFNLVLYADKTKPNQLVCDTFNNWYKEAEIKVLDRYVDQGETLTITPLNQHTIEKVIFSDREDKEYISDTWKKSYNRAYGAAFYQDTSSFYSQGEFKVETTFASAPLVKVPGSFRTGSTGCRTYQINYGGIGPLGAAKAYYTTCQGAPATQSMGGGVVNAWICARQGSVSLVGSQIGSNLQGECSGSATAQELNEMYIPYYIANANYEPARVSPRLMFYNGMKKVQPWHFRGSGSSGEGINVQYNTYPYFDNYSADDTSVGPQVNSLSLLFNNEFPSFGTIPSSSLIDTYWNRYLDLYYNSNAKVVDCAAVIPLGEYFQIELNDLAYFRGNYYHIRAINDYNLTTGECKLQLLGPILSDALSYALGNSGASIPVNPTPTPTPTPTATPTPTPTPTPTGSAPTCTSYTFSANQGFSATAVWVDCADGTTKSQFVNVNDTLTVCARTGTANGLPITNNGPCTAALGQPINIGGVAYAPNSSCTAGAIVYVTAAVATLYAANSSFADIQGYSLYTDDTLGTVIPQTYASDANGEIWNVSAGTLVSATGNIC